MILITIDKDFLTVLCMIVIIIISSLIFLKIKNNLCLPFFEKQMKENGWKRSLFSNEWRKIVHTKLKESDHRDYMCKVILDVNLDKMILYVKFKFKYEENIDSYFLYPTDIESYEKLEEAVLTKSNLLINDSREIIDMK